MLQAAMPACVGSVGGAEQEHDWSLLLHGVMTAQLQGI